MGFRDRIKQTARTLIGRAEPSPAATPVARPAAPSPAPALPPVATPAPSPAPARPATPAPSPAAPNPSASPTPPASTPPAAAARPAPGARAPTGRAPLAVSADGFRAVAPADRVTERKPGTFPLDGATIVAVFRQGGRLWCIDNACAHEDGPVGEGDVTGTCVRCPYHDWEYDFTTGACHTDPERSLATYAVREEDGFIWVGPRLTPGTQARGGDHNDGLETITR